MRKSYEPNNKLFKILLRENLHLLISWIILTPIYYYITEGKQFILDLLFVKIMAIIFLIYNLPNLIIFFNYYRENRNTKIIIDTKLTVIEIIKNGISKQYNISEIKSSIYHLGIYYKNSIDGMGRWKMMNSDLAYWDLEFNNGDRFYITNLLVDFLHEKPIIENTRFRFRMFQYIKKLDSEKAIELKENKEKNTIEKFVNKFQSKTENQLNEILNNKGNYQKEAVEAAKIVMKNKNVG